jgi:flagellar P-ring protein precursor FlgI
LKNVAAVMVTANLPAFARAGQLIDITVSSIGNAKSLKGGTLILTPLKGADGQVYAMAQGNLWWWSAPALGCRFQGDREPSVRRPHSGGAIGRTRSADAAGRGRIRLSELNSTDFGTAQRLVAGINRVLPGAARPPMAARFGCARRPTRMNA